MVTAALLPLTAHAQHHGHEGHSSPPAKLATVSYIDVENIDMDSWAAKDCKVTRPEAPPGSNAEPPPTNDALVVIGDPGEFTAQLENPRFVSSYTASAFGKPKRERWSREPAGGATAEGMFEVSIYPCRAAPTSSQRDASIELVKKSFRAAEKHGWFDYAVAESSGFHRITGGDDYHFVNEAALTDGRVLDPNAPEFLLYYNVGGKMTLTGVMYVMPRILDRGPQIGGPLTLWHYHKSTESYCFRNGIMIGMPSPTGECTEGTPATRTPEMLHVWFVPRVTGAFATDMIPPKPSEP